MRRLPGLTIMAVSLLTLAGAVILYFLDRPLYMAALARLMLRPLAPPFVDLHYIFANAQCWSRGINVYLVNPCDPLLRKMDYSPLMLRITPLVNPSWSLPAGLALAGFYCLSLACLPPTGRWRDQAIIGAAALSSLAIFAVERGNCDAIVYMAILAVAFCLNRSGVMRGLGYGAICFLAMLKFYPLAALLVVIRERLIAATIAAAAASCAIAVFILAYRHELPLTIHNIPKGPLFTDMIGAVQLPAGIQSALKPIMRALAGQPAAASIAASALPVFLCLVLAMALIGIVMTVVARSAEARHAIANLPPTPSSMFLMGAAMMAACFFAEHNVGYRGIVLLLVLPAMLLLEASEQPVAFRFMWRLTIGAIVLVMDRLVFVYAVQGNEYYPTLTAFSASEWILFEVLWWWVIAVLGGIMLVMVIQSVAMTEFWRMARGFRRGQLSALP